MTDTGFPQLSDPNYRIESVLGAGGGGVVYKAWHERLQKYVVLKRIKEDSGLVQEQFRIEVDILKNLKHSHLPQMYDFLTEPGGIYTVMEFISGRSFSELLKITQRFPQQDIVKWAEQLSSALAYLHKQKPPVLHSDIKPANIMLTSEGDVCLIDFNISLILGESGADMIGLSHGYASPEQYGPQALPSSEIGSSLPSAGIISSGAPYDPAATILEPTEYIEAATSLDPETNGLQQDNAAAVPDDLPGRAPVANAAHSPSSQRRREKIRMDMRSDIYSFGATLYHMLTGEKPAISTGKIKPLSDFGLPLSEGIVYIIERCMERNPANRFQTAGELHEAVKNIHRHDTRWKVSHSKRIAAAVIFPVLFGIFTATALYGGNVMAQEKEERYYSYIYDIENSLTPQEAYDAALDIYWDRIDPYRAMAMRLWSEGDIEACRIYIEQNLGNIAKFSGSPDAARDFGDIYFILGNCHYSGAIDPDYHLAKGNFEIAVQYVKDNPVYYRDYAISLARTGDISDAEHILERAQVLGLDTDSLNLLRGEVAFAKSEYDAAEEFFLSVIKATTDDYIRYRAYHTSDEIYKLLGRPEQSVTLLSDAINKIPLSCIPEITERLADAYIKSGDYASAVTLFEQLTNSGAPQFHLMEGMAIMLQELGELDSAGSVLERMTGLFPDDYRVYMRLAYLEADMQSRIGNEDRDYRLTAQYFDTAADLYQHSRRPGESDTQMQQLEHLIEQLRINGWIE